MSEARTAKLEIIDRNGTRGTLDLAAMPPGGNTTQLVCVRLDNNTQLFIDSEKIVERKEGYYYYPETFEETSLAQNTDRVSTSTAPTREQLVVPIIAEEMTVEKRAVEQGGIRIIKTVTEHNETIDLPLMEEQTEVERIPINRPVESAPPVRYEGDVMIVPLLEEVIVFEKRLMLREELRIRKRQVETRKPQQVILRREEAQIERFHRDGEGSSETPEKH